MKLQNSEIGIGLFSDGIGSFFYWNGSFLISFGLFSWDIGSFFESIGFFTINCKKQTKKQPEF